MFIYLPEIKSRSGEVCVYHFQEDLADCFDEFSEGGNVMLVISATYSGEEVMISGSLEGSLAAACSRCLEPFNQKFGIKFTDAFAVIKDRQGEEALDDLAKEAANMLTVAGDYLYLDEYIRQMIILAQDHNPLCKPDCRGLCSGCGVNLNLKECECVGVNKEIDIRLLKLKELLPGNQI